MFNIEKDKMYFIKIFFIKGKEEVLYSDKNPFQKVDDEIVIDVKIDILSEIIRDETSMVIGECYHNTRLPENGKVIKEYSVIKNQKENKIIIKELL